MSVAAVPKPAVFGQSEIKTVGASNAGEKIGKVRVTRTRLLFGAVAALAIAGGSIYFHHWYVVSRFIQSTNNAYLRADQVSMAPRVSGYVSDIYVQNNDEVTAGQPLIRVDARRYEVALRQAKATVNARQADVEKSEADLRQQDAMIAQAQADEANADSAVDLAQKELDRSATLVARGFTTQQQNDHAQNTLKQTKSVSLMKQAVLEAAQRQVATRTAEVDQARAQLAAARESQRQAELDLEDTTLRASIAGRVGDRTAQIGQFVQPGTLLLTIVPTRQLYLVANFKETQIENMRAGLPADIKVDAYPGLALHGTIDSFAPGTGSQFALLPPENATGNFIKIVQRVPVRIRVDAPASNAPALVPGLSVEVSVNTNANAPVRHAQANGASPKGLTSYGAAQ
jgi:membrane fusion protein (multidrug efflux system)